jgi:hypothetical protein
MAVSTSPSALSSFPIPRIRLIGREAERGAARSLLIDAAVPLLTLTGPGGVGKTRLGLAIASDVAPAFADGVAWVDLSPLTDSALVPEAVAAALSITLQPGISDGDELVRHLRRGMPEAVFQQAGPLSAP